MTTGCRFMKDKYTPAILSIPGKITILLGTVALLASGIYGVTQVRNMTKKSGSKIRMILAFLIPKIYRPIKGLHGRAKSNSCSFIITEESGTVRFAIWKRNILEFFAAWFLYNILDTIHEDIFNTKFSFPQRSWYLVLLQATQGFDLLDLAPDDHYSRDCKWTSPYRLSTARANRQNRSRFTALILVSISSLSSRRDEISL